MAYIGRQPTAAALTASDITDGIISNAKLAQDIISADTALGATPADTDELLVSDAGVLKRMDYSYIKAANTPAFEAYLSSTQAISDNTFTKISINTEVFDTASAYDNSSNYRFTVPAGQGGKYFVYGMAQCYASYDANASSRLAIYKNGSIAIGPAGDYRTDGTRVAPLSVHTVMDLSATDYLEIYALIDVTANSPEIAAAADSLDSGNYGTRFGAYKIIE